MKEIHPIEKELELPWYADLLLVKYWWPGDIGKRSLVRMDVTVLPDSLSTSGKYDPGDNITIAYDGEDCPLLSAKMEIGAKYYFGIFWDPDTGEYEVNKICKSQPPNDLIFADR